MPLLSPLMPYAKLARWDKPIGIWLLFIPCAWGLALSIHSTNIIPPPSLFLLFFLGALFMRGAGCSFNDMVDMKIDAKIARTKNRVLVAGETNLKKALVFLCLQCLLGLLVLLQLNHITIILGFLSLPLILIYPFTKRIIPCPQVFLGVVFNWGVLMGYMAMTHHIGSINPMSLISYINPLNLVSYIDGVVFLLYLAAIFWTVFYDTIYALQDIKDDPKANVKSCALIFGAKIKKALIIISILMILCFAVMGALVGMAIWFWLFLMLGIAHLCWQLYILKIDNPQICLKVFCANRDFGFIIFLAILMGTFHI